MYRLITDAEDKIERPENPRANANYFEVLTFSWLLNLFKIGQNRDLDENDLYATLNDCETSTLSDKLEKAWKLEVKNAYKVHRNPSLIRALLHTFGCTLLINGVVKFVVDTILKILQILLIRELLSNFNTDGLNKSDIRYAYFCVSGILLTKLINIIIHHSNVLQLHQCGMKIRAASSSLIYKKAMCLNPSALDDTSESQVINLLSNDLNRFTTSIVYFHYFWIGPLQTIIVIFFLWQEFGISSIFAVSTYLLFIPIQGWLGKRVSLHQFKMAQMTDKRVRLIKEIILGMQLIKMCTWENQFAKLIEFVRKKEMYYARISLFTQVILNWFAGIQTKFQLFVFITSSIFLGNNITIKKVYVIIPFLDLLAMSMGACFPRAVYVLSQLFVSIRRTQKFLLLDENYGKTVNHCLIPNNQAQDTDNLKTFGIVVSNITAKWTNEQNNNSLQNVDLAFENGQLAAIIGPTGAGKSSLLQAIIGELSISGGNISVCGVISYSSQEPWLFSGSIRQNILFNSPMDKQRYEKVIDVCALKTDFDKFAYGDRTLVGERGINLSGGQRARINLARAVYKQADIYLLDDPLSAVDAKVGNHLFEKCIKDFLKDKTCILITHQIQYLSGVDKIVIMKQATILADGSYQYVQASGIDFAKLLNSPEVVESNIDETNESLKTSELALLKCSISSSNGENISNELQSNNNDEQETRSSGNISKNVYISYLFSSGSYYKVIFLITVFFIMQFLITYTSLWIGYWVVEEEKLQLNSTDLPENNNNTFMTHDSFDTQLFLSSSRTFYVLVYTSLTISLIVGLFISSFMFVSVFMKSSINLHNKMLNAIMRVPMYFFNTNSSGRILNRFSKDIGVIDDLLPCVILECLKIILSFVGVIFIIGVAKIYLILPIFIFTITLYQLSSFYLKTSRSLKRLEGVTLSPIFSHMNESIQGLTTIRIFRAGQMLSAEFNQYQNLYFSAWYLSTASKQSLGFWIDIVCLIFISIVFYSFLITANIHHGGVMALAMIEVHNVTTHIQWGIRQSTTVENEITSVERVLEYIHSSQEAPFQSIPDKSPKIIWPNRGEIEFKNFYLRYTSNGPYALKNLNIRIQSMEKIGIVGRTGAGKSSIVAALFRLAINEGTITIDDRDINELGLHELRSKISIIPQDPVVFSGTIRKNLDLFDEYSDHIIWNALHEVELKSLVENLPGGLNSKTFENGSNFSIGQRQLLCLARSILRDNKILVLDEATANVDLKTDTLIQETIRRRFQNCTVLTIAHRLNTIMDSDKLVVIDDGEVVEFDHPYNLLKNEDGFLFNLVKQTGQATSNSLHTIAKENFNTIQMNKKFY